MLKNCLILINIVSSMEKVNNVIQKLLCDTIMSIFITSTRIFVNKFMKEKEKKIFAAYFNSANEMW